MAGRWLSGLGSSLYSVCGHLFCPHRSQDLYCRTSHQPPRGRNDRQAQSLVSSSGPFFMPLPRLLPLAVAGPPFSPTILIPLPLHPFCYQQNLGTFTEASSLPFFFLELSHLHLSQQALRSPSTYWRGDCSLSLLPAGLGSVRRLAGSDLSG